MSADPTDLRLRERMASLGVAEADLEETFVRSSGHGGQNVNKTSTCVVLVYRPSGLEVRCQSSRSQGLNRFLARHLLLDKLEAVRRARAAAALAAREKVRRRDRKRSRAAQRRVREDKARRAEKKNARRRSLED